MEDESKPKQTGAHGSLATGDEIIITVEELERRKDRFRKATKEYYEQAEKGFRILHGLLFCDDDNNTDLPCTTIACNRSSRVRSNNSNNSNNHFNLVPEQIEARFSRKRKRNGTTKTLKRCRQRRFQITGYNNSNSNNKKVVPVLEADLAERLLESHFNVVDLAIQEYLFAIRNLVRPAPILPRPFQREHHDRMSSSSSSAVLVTFFPLPLPIALQTSGSECLQSRLERHLSEAMEEEHLAMASILRSSRESKITKDLAQKIHSGIDSIQISLRRIASLFGDANHHQNNNNASYFCCHYDWSFPAPSDSPEVSAAATIFRPSSAAAILQQQRQQQRTNKVEDSKEVVDALKLDGYFRWFRENNGVLLVQNNDKPKENDHDNINKNNNKINNKVNRAGGYRHHKYINAANFKKRNFHNNNDALREKEIPSRVSCAHHNGVTQYLVLRGGEGEGEIENVFIGNQGLRRVSVDEELP